MKKIHVAVLECEDKESLKKAIQGIDLQQRERINFMQYAIDDGKLRMVFAALKEGVVPTD